PTFPLPLPDALPSSQVRQTELDARVRRAGPAPPSARPPPRAAVTARTGEGAVPAELIVLLALRGIAQHVVRLVDLLEALGRLGFAGLAVRMVLLGQSAEGALDLVDGRSLRDP